MRACFLKSNIAALGYGVAIVQTQPAPEPEKTPVDEEPDKPAEALPTWIEDCKLDPYH